ncbi:hypothetical protein JOF28_000050 [Leucobacter exalbidus]|uniref:Bacteriocin biosynthesis cyclodehydratase domain-containing protein n=1 Tax=Leucobacter exalbidus TaxID=662960 RepID=A0A940PKQ5_9MICO|nr:hypothetical protein [Leucobacter exalbidus]MBP1324818.1 hypothetical protein [Leucobacter exalbidus]
MSELLIDPNLPLCWEDPDTLRVGFEHAHARLHDPSPGVQRLLYALLRGVDPALVAESARAVGISAQEAREVLAALAPALVTPATSARAARGSPALCIAVCDAGREVAGLATALAGTGLCRLDFALETQSPDLVVHVERFLEPLARAQRWLIAGIPQLLIRFTDTAVHVGPIIEPPGSPCHTCIALDLVSRDPSYPVMAAQLMHVTPRSETAGTAGVAAGFAGSLIRDWKSGLEDARRTRIVIPTSHGRVHAPPYFETVTPHDDCACMLG